MPPSLSPLRLTPPWHDLIWQAQRCHLEFVQFEILINELGATFCFVIVAVVFFLLFPFLLRPVCLLFVFSLPFTAPVLGRRCDYKGLWLHWVRLWSHTIADDISDFWVTQLETFVCVLQVLYIYAYVSEKGAMAASRWCWRGEDEWSVLLSRTVHSEENTIITFADTFLLVFVHKLSTHDTTHNRLMIFWHNEHQLSQKRKSFFPGKQIDLWYNYNRMQVKTSAESGTTICFYSLLPAQVVTLSPFNTLIESCESCLCMSL